MSYKIASFNIQKFSTNSDKDLDEIASMIKKEGICIMAIQEIFSEEAMKKLLNALNMRGGKWDGRWDTPNSKSVSAAEGYAFIWDTRVIGLTKNMYDKPFEPRILNQYKMDKETFRELVLANGRNASELNIDSAVQEKIIRNPYYGRFSPVGKPGGSYFEFRLINAHIMFSTSRERNESENQEDILDLSDVIMRRNEYNLLTRSIYPKIFNKDLDYILGQRDSKYMPAYTLLMGDYNLNLAPGGAQIGAQDRRIEIEDGVTYPGNEDGKKVIVTKQDELTTLKTNSKLQQRNDDITEVTQFVLDGDVHANNYDHFTYDEKSFEALNIKRIYRVDCDKYIFKSMAEDDKFAPYREYRKKISDHLPIVIEIEINTNY